MTIHDVSIPITKSLVVWPGQPAVEISTLCHLRHAHNATVSRLSLSVHSGTHVDAPCHFIAGERGVDSLSLDVLVGRAYVADARDVEALTADVLDSLDIPAGTTRLLMRTRNSEVWTRDDQTFHKDYVAFTEDGASWLIDHGIQLLGIDYHSVAPYRNTRDVHLKLLGAGLILLETLDLHAIEAGVYQLVCLPLNIVGSDGAPARVILIDQDS